MENVGDKIRIERLTKNLSQEYMAFALEITQAAYSNLERGQTEITLRRIFEIAEILEISPFILMPKPKFGTGLNYNVFWNTIFRIRKVWSIKIRERIKRMPTEIAASHSDISNSFNN